jgi:hypothetical protein
VEIPTFREADARDLASVPRLSNQVSYSPCRELMHFCSSKVFYNPPS